MKLEHNPLADTTDASFNHESPRSSSLQPSSLSSSSSSSWSHSCPSQKSHDFQKTACPRIWPFPFSVSPSFSSPMKRLRTLLAPLSIVRTPRNPTSMNATSGNFKPPKVLSLYAVIPLGIYLLSAPILVKMDAVLRSAVHVFLVISLLLSSCCCGHVINKPLPPLFGRYPRAAQNTPSSAPLLPFAPSPYPSPPSSSPSSNSSQSNNLSSSLGDEVSRNHTELYLKTVEPLLANATKTQLVAVLISTLEKLGAIPTSNASFCVILEKIADGLKEDSSSQSSFELQLSFSLNAPGDNGALSDESKDELSGSSDDVTQTDSNALNATAATSTCVSDPEIVVTLALIAGANGIPRMEGGNSTAGLIPGEHGGPDNNVYQSGVYGILETGRLSRTQVVVISTCSAIIGMFFLAAAFLRIRNYIKRFRSEQANARRKKFRSCSVALKNPTSSMEQLRRESLASKNSQQNSYSTKGSNASQTNVSSREHSSAGSLRQDPDTTPLLVITKATVEQAATPTDTQSIAGQTSGDQTTSQVETVPSRPRSSNTSPNPSIRTGSQPELSRESHSRSNTPDLVAPSGSSPVTRQVSQETPPLQGHLNHSYSHPRFLGSAASVVPAPHPKLASLKGRERGLVRASSLGTDRNVRRQEFSRGSLKNRGSRRGNKVHSKSDASSYRRFAGEPSLDYQQQQGSFDNNIGLSCDLLKNISFDSTTSSSTNGSCLTCDAISRRLDLICNSVRVAQCPFNVPVSRMPMHYNKTPGKAAKLDMMGGSLDYGYRMSPLCSELQYAKRNTTFSVDGQAVSPGEAWKSANSFPGASASLEQMRTSPLPRERQLWTTPENEGVQSRAYSPGYYGERNTAYQPIPESVNSENVPNVNPISGVDTFDQRMNKNFLGVERRRHPLLTKSVSVCVDSFSEDASPELSLNRERGASNATLNSSRDHLSNDEINSRQSPSSDILTLNNSTTVRYITPGSSMGDNSNTDNSSPISDGHIQHIDCDVSRTRDSHERPEESDSLRENLASENQANITSCLESDSGVTGSDSYAEMEGDTSCVDVLSHKNLEIPDSDTQRDETSDELEMSCREETETPKADSDIRQNADSKTRDPPFPSNANSSENITDEQREIQAGEDSSQRGIISDGNKSPDIKGYLKDLSSTNESLPSSSPSPCAGTNSPRVSLVDGENFGSRQSQFCDIEAQHEEVTVESSDQSEDISAEVSLSSIECEHLNESDATQSKRSQSPTPPHLETTAIHLDGNGISGFHNDESCELLQDTNKNGPLSSPSPPTTLAHGNNGHSNTFVDKITGSNSLDNDIGSTVTTLVVESEDP